MDSTPGSLTDACLGGLRDCLSKVTGWVVSRVQHLFGVQGIVCRVG